MRDPSRGHRFPREVILLAVRWYCRFPLSYQDVADLLAERGITDDRATVVRWVRKFGPEIAGRAHAHRGWRGLNRHADENYARVGGEWRYVSRPVDQKGQFIDFRLTATRDAKAVEAFSKQAMQGERLYCPVSICTDKVPGDRKEIDLVRNPFSQAVWSTDA